MTLKLKKRIALVIFLHIFIVTGCVSTSTKKASPKEIADANVNLAAEYFRLNRMEEALTIAKKAIAADAGSLGANSLLALIYQRVEKPKRAETYFLAALEVADEDTKEFGIVHNNYGVFLCQNDRRSEADENFLIAANNVFYKTPLEARENAAVCALKLKNKSLAEKYFRNILKLSPNRRRPLIEMAKIQYDNRKFLSSRAFLQRYHSVVSRSAESLYLAIKIEDKLDANDAVKRLKDELKSQFPKSEETLALEN